MKAWKQFAGGILGIVVYGFGATALRAQEQNDEKPKPAARVLLPLPDLNGNQQDDNENNQTMQPDRGPVVGVQSPTLGTSELRHSYWVPGIQYSNMAQSNNFNSTGSTQNPGWTTTNYASGNLSLLEAWNHALFGANYSGGGFFSTDANQGNGQYHQLSSAFQLDERRWQLLVMEQLAYLPQSAFGFGGTTGLSMPGISGALSVALPGLQEVFAPGQTVYAATGPRHNNDSAAQLTYSVTRRSSFTFAAVYGLLRFSLPGNTNSDMEIANVGYNYALTRKDSVGVIYRFTALHFPGNPQALGIQVAQVMYGRRVTGKLALNLAGGPEIIDFRVPVNGIKRTISGSGNASLVYASRIGRLQLDYSHGVGSGGGVFGGSNSDLLIGSLNRPLGRAWSSTLSFGYARDRQLVTIQSLSSPTYDSWRAAAGVTRPLGAGTTLSIGYQAQIQASTGILCAPTGCQTVQTTHQIQMSFQWQAPAQVLR